jgi:tRNA nucleotidyltransferase/poly(A) polymerase
MDPTPRAPQCPLLWSETVIDLQDFLVDVAIPVYIVGGAVRDAYLHRPLKDIDLATPADSIKLARQIANRLHGDIFVLDDERGVGRVLVNMPEGKLTLDVARFRGADLLADLADRDFTINAMGVDARADLGKLIDPLNGEQDLLAKLLRRCSPHAISDDPIRTLRAVRQSVQLRLRIEAQTLGDIRAGARHLLDVSPERIRDEVVNILSLPTPAAALRIADTMGLLEYVIPETRRLHDIQVGNVDGWQHALAMIEHLTTILSVISPQRTEFSTTSFSTGMLAIQIDRYRPQITTHLRDTWANDRPHQALLVLAALLANAAESNERLIEERLDALRLSNAEKQWLVTVVKHLTLPAELDVLDKRALHRFWHSLGAAGVDLCLLALADHLARSGAALNQDKWLALVDRIRVLLETYYERYEQIVFPPPLLDGNQLMKLLGIHPGPVVGELLDMIREGQAAGEIQTREKALGAARAYLETH